MWSGRLKMIDYNDAHDKRGVYGRKICNLEDQVLQLKEDVRLLRQKMDILWDLLKIEQKEKIVYEKCGGYHYELIDEHESRTLNWMQDDIDKRAYNENAFD